MFGIGAVVLAIMWLIFIVRILLGAAMTGSLMTPGARLAAAIEVLADIEARRRPAADALKDWGLGAPLCRLRRPRRHRRSGL